MLCDFKGAIADFDEALRLKPEDSLALGRGEVKRMGDFEEANASASSSASEARGP